MQVAIVKRSFFGDPHCGDECAYWQSDGKAILCIADGLGHGEEAEQAAQAAVDYVARHLAQPLADIFAGCDRALHRTRGVTMGIAVIDKEAETLTYAGVGNPRAMIVRGAPPVVCLSNNYGIVGGGYRKLTPETVELHPGDLVILTSDGIKERCDVLAYGEMLHGNVHRLAERILHDWGRETDDVAVLVFRNEEV